MRMDSYLLDKHATDNVSVEAKTKIQSFKQPTGMTAFRYSQDILEKTCRCGIVYS